MWTVLASSLCSNCIITRHGTSHCLPRACVQVLEMVSGIFGATFAVEAADGTQRTMRLADFICNCGTGSSAVEPAMSSIVVGLIWLFLSSKKAMYAQHQSSACVC